MILDKFIFIKKNIFLTKQKMQQAEPDNYD